MARNSVETRGIECRFAPSRGVGVLAFVGLAVIGVGLLSLILRPTTEVYDRPLTEDGYYSLTVARNVAAGNGLTIDGRTATNGIQPLFTFATVPAFWVAGDDTALAIRAVLVIHILVLFAAGFVLGRIVADTFPGQGLTRRAVVGLTALAYASAILVITTGLNGLETGLLILGYALVWRVYQVRGVRSPWDAVLLGVLLGGLVLARIDASVFVAVFCAYLAFVLGGDDRVRGVVVGATALLVSAPWWLYGWLQFGSLMPSSGKAGQQWAITGSRVTELVSAWSHVVVPWLDVIPLAGRLPGLVRFAAVVGGIAAWGWMRRHPADMRLAPADPTLDSRRVARAKHFAALLGVTAGLLSIWYVLSSHATYFYGRYLAFVMLLAVFFWMRFGLLVWARSRGLMVSAFAALVAGGVAVCVGFHTPALAPTNPMYRDQLALVRRAVPEQASVAAFQSGTLGFFRGRVINLDGTVNAEALHHQSPDGMDAYLRGLGVQWVCDWPLLLAGLLHDRAVGWRSVAERGAFMCIHRTG
jgi:hypothetical protein